MGIFDTFLAVGLICLTKQAKFKYRQVNGNHNVCDSSNHLSCYLKTMIIHHVLLKDEDQPNLHA